MNDNFEKGECGARGVGLQCQGRGSRQKAVHHIIWIGSKTDEKQQLWAFFNSAYDAPDARQRVEPSVNRIAEK